MHGSCATTLPQAERVYQLTEPLDPINHKNKDLREVYIHFRICFPRLGGEGFPHCQERHNAKRQPSQGRSNPDSNRLAFWQGPRQGAREYTVSGQPSQGILPGMAEGVVAWGLPGIAPAHGVRAGIQFDGLGHDPTFYLFA